MRITRLGQADVYALTGVTVAEVDRITAITDPGHRPGRPPGLTHRDRVLLTLVALRTNLTERALAAIFDTSQPTAHRIIRDLTAAVAGLFVPDQFDDTDTLLLDGTLIPVHDQSITRPSKNYRRSVNIQVIATLNRRIVRVGNAWPGNRNDIVVAKATITLPAGITTLTDGGYRSMPGATLPPTQTTPPAWPNTVVDAPASNTSWPE
ncbi:helix-turn-helix domain-containing protein [Mycobacterium camsae]|uniref:helix-turn-helix domain-containing protein n=1 Tax=Mycobacterium gordonae TaxID=1778 RepID=UPI00197EBCC0|nr:transposase family protein [Mycobacterium gordonae]